MAWGDSEYANVPEGLSAVTSISAGAAFSLALKNDGTVVAWGGSEYTTVPAGLSGVTAISAGGVFSLALVGSPAGEDTWPAWALGVLGLGLVVLAALTGLALVLVLRRRAGIALQTASPPGSMPLSPGLAATPTPVWVPTHSVPAGGMSALALPGSAGSPVAPLPPGLGLRVLQRAGDWAQVQSSDGWSGWVDGRQLVEK